MNNPFDLIKAFYSKDWNKIKDRDKARNFFMVNRICAIKFPLQTNAFNNIKIQPERAVDFLKILMLKTSSTYPQWTWTKTKKKEKEKPETKYDQEVIDFIKEKYQISNREINDLQDFFPSQFKKYYKEIETLLR